MKTAVDVKELKAALDLVKPCVATRTYMATLSGVRLEVTPGGWLTVDGTDLDATATVSIPCQTTDFGSVIVPLKQLQNTLKTAKGQLELEVIGEQLTTVNGTKSLIPTLSADEWPRKHELTKAETAPWEVRVDVLRGIVLAASTDNNKPFLTTIHLNGTEAVATDAYRLHWADLPLAGLTEPALVPAIYIERILKAQRKLKEPLHMSIARSEFSRYVVFDCGQAVWRLRLVDGDFPNWKNLIPTSSEFSATFEREPIMAALASIIGSLDRGSAAPIRMVFGGGTAHLSVSVADTITTETDVPCSTEGVLTRPQADPIPDLPVDDDRPVVVGFNPNYLRDSIAAGVGDTVRIEFVNTHKPVAFRDDSAVSRLLMPVKIP